GEVSCQGDVRRSVATVQSVHFFSPSSPSPGLSDATVFGERLWPEISMHRQQHDAERGQTEPGHDCGPRVLNRVRGDAARGDGEEDADNDAAPRERPHQRSPSAGVSTMRYVHTAPSRGEPVVDAAKQST